MFLRCAFVVALAFSSISRIASASDVERCPESSALYRSVETKVFPNDGSRNQKMSIFYFLTAPYDQAKPVLVYLNGGPGDYTMPANAWTHPDYNVVYVHHRGAGCSKVLSDYRPRYLEPYFSIDYAVADLEEVRKDLLGPDGRWFVYGISYGGILAQAYALKNAAHIEGLILDSTFYGSSQITFAREQLFDLFFLEDSSIHQQLQAVLTKYPEVRIEALRIAAYSSNYKLRAVYLPQLLQDLADSPSLTDAQALLERLRTPLYPKVGMAREITCREMWDFPLNDPRDEYYLPGFNDDCRAFKDFRAPFDYSEGLSALNVRTMIWGGKYDPITPLESMKRMNQWIPGSLLWANQFAGHGLIREKRDCAERLLSLFAHRASDAQIKTVMDSDLCQSPPAIDPSEAHQGLAFPPLSF
jgi:pimeloyl-ACP methyl ester carboxylesterase